MPYVIVTKKHSKGKNEPLSPQTLTPYIHKAESDLRQANCRHSGVNSSLEMPSIKYLFSRNLEGKETKREEDQKYHMVT